MTHAVHPLQACWDAALAPVRAQALELALTLDVFSLLRAPSTPAALAARLSLAPANTAHWLELLWSMGLLTRQPAGDVWAYGVADALAPYLLAGAADDCRHALRHRLHTLAEFAGQLPAWLTRDAIEPAASASAWAQAGQSHLAQEQRAVTAKVALDCVAGLPGLDGERWACHRQHSHDLAPIDRPAKTAQRAWRHLGRINRQPGSQPPRHQGQAGDRRPGTPLCQYLRQRQ